MRNLYIHLQNKKFTNVFGCIEALSEAVKVLKAEYLVKAITAHKMDQAIIFCRTKIDCDNIENYLQRLGGGSSQSLHLVLTQYPDYLCYD